VLTGPRNFRGELIPPKGVKSLVEITLKKIVDTVLSSGPSDQKTLHQLFEKHHQRFLATEAKLQKKAEESKKKDKLTLPNNGVLITDNHRLFLLIQDMPALYQTLRKYYGYTSPDPRVARQKRAENRFQEAKARYKVEVARQQPEEVYCETNTQDRAGTSPDDLKIVYVPTNPTPGIYRPTVSAKYKRENPHSSANTSTSTKPTIQEKVWSHFNPHTVDFKSSSNEDYRQFKQAKGMIWQAWSKKKDYDQLQQQKQGAAQAILTWYRRRKDINSLAAKMINTAKTLKKEEKAAKVIQRVYRGHQGRIQAKNLRTKRFQAAKMIQRVYRGHQGRTKANAIKVEQSKEKDLNQVAASKSKLPKFRIGKHGISRSKKT